MKFSIITTLLLTMAVGVMAVPADAANGLTVRADTCGSQFDDCEHGSCDCNYNPCICH
ncbi:hypothetical protein WAI453_010998 [Rhynchosporium graminicola]